MKATFALLLLPALGAACFAQEDSAPRNGLAFSGVFDFGAGLDIRIWRLLALQGEARDYYTGSPDYNVATISGRQQNIVATGGFVPRWH
jgi:hypothetical protein